MMTLEGRVARSEERVEECICRYSLIDLLADGAVIHLCWSVTDTMCIVRVHLAAAVSVHLRNEVKKE